MFACDFFLRVFAAPCSSQQSRGGMSGWWPFGGGGDAPAPADDAPKKSPTCKICCACPDERAARDKCVIFNGQAKCMPEIDAFYKCLLTEGFTQAQVDQLRQSATKRA